MGNPYTYASLNPQIRIVLMTCEVFTLIDVELSKSCIVFFLQNLTMIRLPEAKSCFLSDATDDVPKPADLVELLVSLEFNTKK